MTPAADPYGLHEAGGFVVFALAVLFLYVAQRISARRRAADPSTAAQARPAADPQQPAVPYLGNWECWRPSCDRIACDWVEHPIAGRLYVCGGCAREGARLGWWVTL